MLRIAIIGTGGIAHAHVQGYLKFPEQCEIVALCDKFEDKAEIFKSRYELSAGVYGSHHDLFSKETIDAVSLCLPPYLHKDVAVDALRNGIHVLCEKPLAPSVDECDAMIRAQEESGKLLAVCHQNRFRNDIAEVKHVIDSGVLGKIHFSRFDSFWWRSHHYYDLWWRGTWEKEGGGCILNHAVHHLDLLLWFLGTPKRISSTCGNLAHSNSEVEDFGSAIVRFDGGAVAQFTSSVLSHGEDQQLLFQCEKGKVVSPWSLYCSSGRQNGFPDGRDLELEARVQEVREDFCRIHYENHDGAISNFLNAIEGREELMCTGNEGRRVVEIITLFYLSSVEGQEIDAVISPDNPWYTTQGIMKHAPRYYKKTKSVDNMGDAIVIGQSEQ